MLSQNSDNLLFPIIPNLSNNLWSHIASFIAPIRVLYLNSINDNVMDYCFLLFHVKGMEPNLKFKPSIDFFSSKLCPNLHLWNWISEVNYLSCSEILSQHCFWNIFKCVWLLLDEFIKVYAWTNLWSGSHRLCWALSGEKS